MQRKRGLPYYPDNLKNTDFDVFAFTGMVLPSMGKVDTEFGHDGVNIVYNNGKWDYKNASDASLLAYRGFGLLRVQSRNG